MELSGELLNIRLDSTVFVDMSLKAMYRADAEGIFLEIGEVESFDVEIIDVGPNADEARLRPFLEEQLPFIINGLLVGQGVGPIDLPSLNLSETIENLEAADTLDLVPDGVLTRDGYLLIEGDLD